MIFINIYPLIVKYNVVYNIIMSEFRDTDDKVKDDVGYGRQDKVRF
jgi:hypothetical protein